MEKIAVFNDTHTLGYDMATWMLHDLGYKVYLAGQSFRKVIPNFSPYVRYPPGKNFLTRTNGLPPWDGVMEWDDLPPDALFLDTFPDSEPALRKYGWNGPILLYWILPVGPDYIAAGKFRPGSRVGVLAFNAGIARLIKEKNLCPVEFILPPYDTMVDFPVRDSFDRSLVAAVHKLVDWSNSEVRAFMARLRDHPDTNLELYGLPPPGWATPIEHPRLVERVGKAKALLHVKPTDTPGYAWMEAAFQGVPVIFPQIFKHSTEFFFLENERTCFLADGEKEVLALARRLDHPTENRRVGLALRESVKAQCCWANNRGIVEGLLNNLHREPADRGSRRESLLARVFGKLGRLSGRRPRTTMANILCVDDEPHVVNLRCLTLEAEGHHTTAAWTVREALERLEHDRYDVVVTGWRLGDGSGSAVVKAAKTLKRPPIVVVSGYIEEEDQATPAADLYFEKPIDLDDFAGIIDKLLRGGNL